MAATVACPGCGRTQPARTQDSIYWCEKCRCQFDGDPNEGGDYSDHNAAVRLEREERRNERQGQRRGRR